MPAPAPTAVLPFTLRLDHILIDAQINGTPATLVLDTGSGACGIDAELAGALRLAPGPGARAFGVDSVPITLATIDTLSLGDGVELRNEIAALVPLGDVTAKHGYRICGTIGFPFFARRVVEIDYAARVVRLHDPDTYVYDGPGERIPVDLSRRVPVLQATFTGRDGASMPARLLLDIGTGGFGSVLTKPFVDRNADSLLAGPCVERIIGAGVGGSMSGRVAALGALQIGGLRVPSPIVAMPAEGRGFFGMTSIDGTLGAPILRRTRLIIDYAHGQVILEPIEAMDQPFLYDASGLSLSAIGPGLETIAIDGVTPNSAGAQAGLAPGEVLIAVDGQPVSGVSLEWVAERFRLVGAAYSLRVRGGGQERDVSLRLASSGLD